MGLCGLSSRRGLCSEHFRKLKPIPPAVSREETLLRRGLLAHVPPPCPSRNPQQSGAAEGNRGLSNTAALPAVFVNAERGTRSWERAQLGLRRLNAAGQVLEVDLVWADVWWGQREAAFWLRCGSGVHQVVNAARLSSRATQGENNDQKNSSKLKLAEITKELGWRVCATETYHHCLPGTRN